MIVAEFDENEIKEWYKGFRKDCPSGQLGMDEFKGIYSNFFPGGLASSLLFKLFQLVDLVNSKKGIVFISVEIKK